MNAASRRAYNDVNERAGGVCEGCGEKPATQMHHRRFRSRGGDDSPPNLVHLCLWCHGRAHQPDAPQGWAVSRWGADPANVPFLSYKGLVFLTRDGRYADTSDPTF